jgi:hypothetical protein
MAARFCKRCQINWPVTVVQCTKCGGDTQSFAWRNPDAAVVEPGTEETPETEYDRIIAWRAQGFRELGVDWDTSFMLAAERSANGGFEVDLGRFRELVVKKGWTAKHAVKALG